MSKTSDEKALGLYRGPQNLGEVVNNLQGLLQLGDVLIKSGLVPASIKEPAAAVAMILMGWELGLGPMTSLQNIYPIAGRPTLAPSLMLALARRTGELEDLSIKDDGESCTVIIKRRGQTPHTTSFSMEDARRVQTFEVDQRTGERRRIALADKYNWKQWPREMRQWRAVAANLRVTFSDAMLRLYLPDEVEGLETLETIETGAIEGVHEEIREPSDVGPEDTAPKGERAEEVSAAVTSVEEAPVKPQAEARKVQPTKAEPVKAKPIKRQRLPIIKTSNWNAFLGWAEMNDFAVERKNGEKTVNPFRLLSVLGSAGVEAITDENFTACMGIIAKHYAEKQAAGAEGRAEAAESED